MLIITKHYGKTHIWHYLAKHLNLKNTFI